MRHFILSTLLLAMSWTPALLAQSPSPTPVSDPLVGRWRWGVSHWPPGTVEVRADGTTKDLGNGKAGQWTLQPSSNQERHYAIIWDRGLNVDSIVLSADSKTISGRANGKANIKAERIVLPTSEPNYFGTK